MLEQSVITPSQQEHWFSTINNSRHCLYFMIQHNEKKIGLIHSKDIDWEKREDEGGIFIWDKRYIGSGIPAIASIILMQLCFSIVGLCRTYAHVHPDNLPAKKYNLTLGYSFTEAPNRMVLSRPSYDKNIQNLRKIASRGKDLSPLSMTDISIDARDMETPFFSNPLLDLSLLTGEGKRQASHLCPRPAIHGMKS